MPLSIFKKLEVWEVEPTYMRLQFTDRSIAKVEGKIEEVFVKVEKFLFPTDFVILYYKVDQEVPIILGWPFLSTSCAFIDVYQGELTMRFNDEDIKFNVLNVMNFPVDVENCSAIESLRLDYC
ncbi:uncharacterized protein E5676_scaffold14G001020 [Cucumis melo var. makuwa]|uniref:Uncharacterized protein n=1 Tax=Cucumis melo var. makuwa TaxID=1194695 RepID=A0A5D3DRM6_CUCMM|nr:uncharacterized protein E6C27_scaffold38G001390 [Cucumis melo var. makuwa]TYK26321.1 uncharacterized protein E5676_scaffold14G001020 [Cucumis melo var. makuwa]